MPRTPYIAANWKMNKTVAEAAELFIGRASAASRIAADQHAVTSTRPRASGG